ncbi:MAG: hypothetical protein ACRCWM_06760 [Sarcina sp.]
METIILIDSGRKFIERRNEILKVLNLYAESNEAIEVFDISSVKFKECVGCFNCWTKTPGLCNSEENNELNFKLMNSDNLVIVSEMNYGGFSTSAKRVIDKFVPNVLPHMTIINSEIHHKKRYKKYPNLFTVAYADEITPKYKGQFSHLTSAMGRNLRSNKVSSIMIDKDFNLEEIGKTLNKTLGTGEGM